MRSNASITEILGINDNNLVILGNEKESIKGIEYTVLRGKLSYRPTCCPKCGIVNENYDIIRNGSQTVKILFNRVNTNPLILMVVNVNIKMYKKWKIKMYNLGSTIHQLSYHQ